jgi:hypothetical protein
MKPASTVAAAVVRFFRFWYDFIVGDDWVAAAGAGAALAATALLARAGIQAWWVMPAGVLLVLWITLRRAVARSR